MGPILITAPSYTGLKSCFNLDRCTKTLRLPYPPQTQRKGKIPCDQCKKTFTRPHDLKRHQITRLDGELLEKEKHPCPITETGCGRRMLQLTNLRKHVQGIHCNVAHLVCFHCCPTRKPWMIIFKLKTAQARHRHDKGHGIAKPGIPYILHHHL
ncbi:hypothetical protein EDD18DRAFT_677670 [Armillaria luteobubalina]|uniref:C2H2-type domain-containing protein n=1 Tax=Armillaria luteobubalina TaxID=153913 RepID=A0AA39QFJ4_9AGAR|nr:hypothetical protein EDD18DRAFT_677670 [Armillaria luteobubalina]